MLSSTSSPGRRRSVDDHGNALVELIFGICALFVPLALGVVGIVAVADGAVLAETVVRESARAFVLGDHDEDGRARAMRSARLVFADSGIEYVAPSISCTANPCLTPGASV